MIVFFFNGTATTEIYTYRHTLSLHDALPISWGTPRWARRTSPRSGPGPTPSARQPRQRPPRPPSRHARPRPSADRPGGFEEPERRNCGVLFFGFFASDSPARPEKLKRRVVHGLRKQRRPDRGPRARLVCAPSRIGTPIPRRGHPAPPA